MPLQNSLTNGCYKIDDFFQQNNFRIPFYQRPYEWTRDNMFDLLGDIEETLDKNSPYRYRLGSIILQKKGYNYDIVDGQQRLVSLSLLYFYIHARNPQFTLPPFVRNCLFDSVRSKDNIRSNYQLIRAQLASYSGNKLKKVLNAFKEKLEIVVLVVNNEREAFQLFDSQNARGKELNPHDLLKAYHLRAMRGDEILIPYAVDKWEKQQKGDIRKLFEEYLFPILRWTQQKKVYKEKSNNFTQDDIVHYKGVDANSPYSYGKRVIKAMPVFQITESFVAGNDFFEMVSYYLHLQKYIENKCLQFREKFVQERAENPYSPLSDYLFCCGLLAYYDRFKDLSEEAITKIFIWAYSLRLDMKHLGPRTIDKYAIGEPSSSDGNSYANTGVPLFALIKQARKPADIIKIPLKIKANNNRPALTRILQLCNGERHD